jgi:hypothetical protein
MHYVCMCGRMYNLIPPVRAILLDYILSSNENTIKISLILLLFIIKMPLRSLMGILTVYL